MADWTLVALQARGKVRRFIQANVLREDTDALLAKRKGDCNRCGACCKILFQCPSPAPDDEGQHPCRLSARRSPQCRLSPLPAADLRERGEQCSYTFEGGGEAEPILGPPEPVLD